jgi:hypothetical protein
LEYQYWKIKKRLSSEGEEGEEKKMDLKLHIIC